MGRTVGSWDCTGGARRAGAQDDRKEGASQVLQRQRGAMAVGVRGRGFSASRQREHRERNETAAVSGPTGMAA
jgi:hypothetical protein